LQGMIVVHIDQDSDKHLISDSRKNKVLMIVQKLKSHRRYVVYTKYGRKTQEWVAFSAAMDYDLKPNVQIILSKVIKNTITLTYSMQ